MKKALSLLLCLITIICCFAFSASAMSVSEGLTALQSQFADGENTLDYAYYTPVKKTSDTKKYPLIVWLHGQFSGVDKRHQIEACDVALWSSDEYQAKIKGTGGAFIFVPRDPMLQADLAWNNSLTELKRSIDLFVLKYKKNIDTSRIYIGGFSMGGKGVMRIAAMYPDYFAAIFPMSSVYDIPDSELNQIKDIPMWMFTCRKDFINNTFAAHTVALRIWDYMDIKSSCKSVNRWTCFESPLVNPSGVVERLDPIYWFCQHNTWDAVAHDLILESGKLYSNMTTVDGYGKTVTLTVNETFLAWLSEQSLDRKIVDGEEEDKPTVVLPATSLLEAIEKIFDFINKFIEILFG